LVHSAAQYIPLIGPKAIAVPPQHKMPRVGNVYVANQTDIYVLRPVPLTSRVDQMINEREYKEALSLCMSLTAEEIPNWHEKIRNIKILDAYDLFNRGQYREAFEYFLSENMDPLQVIGLYKLLPASLVEKYHYPFRIDDLKGAGLNNALMELSTYLVQKRSDLKLGLLPPGPQQSWDSTTVLHPFSYFTALNSSTLFFSRLSGCGANHRHDSSQNLPQNQSSAHFFVSSTPKSLSRAGM
jgi:hypothetical protein